MLYKNKLILILLMTVLAFSSCTQQKYLTYLQDIDKFGTENFFPKEKEDYKIQVQDVLYINIVSINPEVNAMFSNSPASGNQSLFQNETSIYINGYVVSDSGYIDIPTIGEVKVINKTLVEIKNIIKEKVSIYIKKAIVEVKLISFKFTVLGEVNIPGVFKNYNNQLSVLEAIGMAGDITEYGNRKKVLVLRPVKDGIQTYRIDLTDTNILTSDGFYLLPNDIVYIEPIRTKLFRINTPTYSMFLTTITTLILILNTINKN